MKRHEFFLEALSHTSLLGISISKYETQLEDGEEWYPTLRIALGFIFFTFSYTRIYI